MRTAALAAICVLGFTAAASAQARAIPWDRGASDRPRAPKTAPAPETEPTQAAVPREAEAQGQAITPPDGYVIGADDSLGILFWRDSGMSGDVIVRPDGNISVPLLNDVAAAGLTPEQLRQRLRERAMTFFDDPNVTVVVRQINSRKVFITGQVTRPGTYPLASRTSVLQLIALAGGLTDFTNGREITIIRPDVPQPLLFNYDEVRRGKRLQQNIELKAGDTVVVP